MKVKILKSGKWAFKPDLPIVEFHKDVIYDVIDESQAKRLLETGYAMKIEENSEIKKQPEGENKAIDLTKVENKTLTLGKSKSRPRKN